MVKGSKGFLESDVHSKELKTPVKIPKPKLVDINLLKLEKNNIKEHSNEQLHDLGVLFDWIGFTDPVIVDSDYEVWAGKGSVIEAKEKGMKKVPVIFMPEDWDESKKKHFMYRDNKINESPWMQENLQTALQEIDPIELEEFQIKVDEYKPPITEETDEIPEVPAESKSKLGDVYQLGRHRIMCGDCTKDVSKLLGETKIDQLVTDPPYGINYSAKNEFLNKIDKGNRIQKEIQNDNIENYRKFFAEFLSVIPFSDYNTCYIFMAGLHLHDLRMAVEDSGITWGDYLVWVKNNHVLGRKDYNPKHEFIVYGWKNRHKFYGKENLTTVLEYDKPRVNDLHPTMKPIEILSKIITDGSSKNANVFDPFLGSGSTLIACEQTGRTCFGMEIDPVYIDVIIERFENFTGQKAEKLN